MRQVILSVLMAFCFFGMGQDGFSWYSNTDNYKDDISISPNLVLLSDTANYEFIDSDLADAFRVKMTYPWFGYVEQSLSFWNGRGANDSMNYSTTVLLDSISFPIFYLRNGENNENDTVKIHFIKNPVKYLDSAKYGSDLVRFAPRFNASFIDTFEIHTKSILIDSSFVTKDDYKEISLSLDSMAMDSGDVFAFYVTYSPSLDSNQLEINKSVFGLRSFEEEEGESMFSLDQMSVLEYNQTFFPFDSNIFSAIDFNFTWEHEHLMFSTKRKLVNMWYDKRVYHNRTCLYGNLVFNFEPDSIMLIPNDLTFPDSVMPLELDSNNNEIELEYCYKQSFDRSSQYGHVYPTFMAYDVEYQKWRKLNNQKVTFSIGGSIPESNFNDKFQLVSIGSLIVLNSNLNHNGTIRLFAINGRQIFSNEVPSLIENRMNLNSFSKGTYVLSIESEGKIYSKKFIIH